MVTRRQWRTEVWECVGQKGGCFGFRGLGYHGSHQPQHEARQPALPVLQTVLVEKHLRRCDEHGGSPVRTQPITSQGSTGFSGQSLFQGSGSSFDTLASSGRKGTGCFALLGHMPLLSMSRNALESHRLTYMP
jgi:hypothetical protein